MIFERSSISRLFEKQWKYDQNRMDSFFGKGISALNSTEYFSLSFQIEKLI